MKKTGTKRKVFIVLNTIFLLFCIGFTIIPFWYTFVLSFSTDLASMAPGLKLWPSEWSVEGYRKIWNNAQLWIPFTNTMIVTAVGTFIHVFLTAMAGYVLIQKQLPGRRFLTSFIITTMMIPEEMIMIQLFVVNKQLGLIDTLTSLIISGIVSGFSILLLTNYFNSIPDSLGEAARIDGANDFFIFRRLYLPLSKPALATVSLFEFVNRWNQFRPALLYIQSPSKYTLQVALRSLVIETEVTSTSDYFATNARMAAIMIAIIPLLALYPFIQKYFVKGIMVGSTKE